MFRQDAFVVAECVSAGASGYARLALILANSQQTTPSCTVLVEVRYREPLRRRSGSV